MLHERFTAYMKKTPQPYFEMEESRSVTTWVYRLYFESPHASSFYGLQLVKTKHKNLVPLLFGVKPDLMVGSGRYAKPIPVKSPLAPLEWGRASLWGVIYGMVSTSQADQMLGSANSSFVLG